MAADSARRALLAAMARVEFRVVRPHDRLAAEAIRQYFGELEERFPGGFAADEQSAHDDAVFSPPVGVFVIAVLDGKVVACGGVQTVADHAGDGTRYAEIKRMWVNPQWRGAGLGHRLLQELEDRAVALGEHTIRLDTHDTLTEAIRLYERAGFDQVERYNDNPYARLWFEKRRS